MARAYRSFLVRHWRLSDDEQRIEIIHIQSGRRTSVTSLLAALAWIGAYDVTGAGRASPDRPALTSGNEVGDPEPCGEG